MEDESKQPTVLLVDDEPNILELFEIFLEDEYSILTASNGDEALDVLSAEIDVVLLDRRMPSTSGEEVLHAIRNQGYEMPVGMVTGIDPGMDIVDMPFDDYLTKPVDAATLQRTVQLLVIRSRFDSKSRAYFSLASKKANIENEFENPQDHEEYISLRSEMKALRNEINDTILSLVDTNEEVSYLLH